MEKSNIKVAFCPEHGLQFFDAQSRTCEHIPREENSMETIDQIHQKLATLNLATFELKEVNRLIERALGAGMTRNLEQADPLAGYSNLTAAIKAGDPIYWERLDGKRVQCRNPDVGELYGMLERDHEYPTTSYGGWCTESMDDAYTTALWSAWRGTDGWTLYIEGEIPMRRKTADQLKVGTYFRGEIREKKTAEMYIGEALGSKIVLYAPRMTKSEFPAEEWVVLEEYGTFQKPEGK